MNSRPELPPTAERLLDVRTPAELAFSPDGSRVAFALHATVADVGSFPPSDLYVRDELEGETRAADERRVERSHARLVAGWRSGSRSSRIGSRPGTSSRTRWRTGASQSLAADAARLGRERCLVERRRPLLVLAADPGFATASTGARVR